MGGHSVSFCFDHYSLRLHISEELIAPLFVEFYDENWNEIGTKQSLCDQIADITSIDPLVLRGTDPTKRTIAERMSWAASRETTRVEDIAYSLMGLFNVFMPMLYGEGSRAFIRLQEEIIKQTEDYTIFAWSSDRSSVPYRGMLAQSPSEFRGSGPHQVCRRLPDFCNHPDGYLPPALSSRGLVLTLPLAPYAAIHGAYLGWIACVTSCPSDEEKETNVLCICLQEVQASPQTFARIDSSKLEKVSMGELRHFKEQSICVVPSTINQNESRARSTFGKVVIQQPTGHDRRYIIDAPAVSQGTDWARDTSSVLFHYEDGNRPVAAISFGSDLDEILVIIGLQDNMLWCSIVFDDDDTINDPIRVLASHSSRGCSDRARATRNGTLVNATLRAARSDQPETSIFNLSLRLSGQS